DLALELRQRPGDVLGARQAPRPGVAVALPLRLSDGAEAARYGLGGGLLAPLAGREGARIAHARERGEARGCDHERWDDTADLHGGAPSGCAMHSAEVYAVHMRHADNHR